MEEEDVFSEQLADLLSFPKIDTKYSHVQLYGNKIKEITPLHDGVIFLNLDDNEITTIKNLPSKMEKLYIEGNYISKIENLPNTLKLLSIGRQKIGKAILKLENFPNNLLFVDFSYCNITKIENLPDSIQTLRLGNNRIKRIENLPKNLKCLYLENNLIEIVENIPESVDDLNLANNRIYEVNNDTWPGFYIPFFKLGGNDMRKYIDVELFLLTGTVWQYQNTPRNYRKILDQQNKHGKGKYYLIQQLALAGAPHTIF